MIQLKEVSKEFHTKKKITIALNDISLEISQGEFFGIVGASGSGKSTLLRLMNGLDNPSKGEILLNGILLPRKMNKEKRNLIQETAMIFQQFNLLQNITIIENIKRPLMVQGITDESRADEMLSFVGLSELKDSYPSQLSGGQKQRVAIARSLSSNPRILLCDEPTSALDETNAKEIMELLKKTQEKFGTTIIFVSHELSLIKEWCTRAAVMEKGQLLTVLDVVKSSTVTQQENYYDKAVRYLT